LRYASAEKVAINDTNTDTDLTVYLLDGDGNEIANGLVPPEMLTVRYEDPTARHKLFELLLMKGSEAIGKMRVQLKYQTSTIESAIPKTEVEGKTSDKPASVLPGTMGKGQVEESKEMPRQSQPFKIDDIPEASGGFDDSNEQVPKPQLQDTKQV
jgi:hypothetical protein